MTIELTNSTLEQRQALREIFGGLIDLERLDEKTWNLSAHDSDIDNVEEYLEAVSIERRFV